MFANHFEDKINIIVRNIPTIDYWESCFPLTPVDKFSKFVKINNSDIVGIIHKMKATYCRTDPFPIAEVKSCRNFTLLVDIYVIIVNLSIEKNCYPSTEKLALVKPLLKGNSDKECLQSFRPISNLPYLSKIIENVILDQLMRYMDDTGTLPDNQSAFRQLYSVETTLCSIINDLIIQMDEGNCSLLILLDLSAAFDTVVHSMLFSDLQKIGIVGNALDLLKDCVLGREYQVIVGNSSSTVKPLQRGVPQGSVLGPILFCIYTIELSHILKQYDVNFKLFADDTQFYLTINDINQAEGLITTILTDVKKWMNYKQLKFNEEKTECLIIWK